MLTPWQSLLSPLELGVARGQCCVRHPFAEERVACFPSRNLEPPVGEVRGAIAAIAAALKNQRITSERSEAGLEDAIAAGDTFETPRPDRLVFQAERTVLINQRYLAPVSESRA